VVPGAENGDMSMDETARDDVLTEPPAAAAFAARLPAPLVGILFLAGFIVLRLLNVPLYDALLTWLGIAPFRFPFVDAHFVLAASECWHRGVDVYPGIPCDAVDRPFIYSPLLLRLPPLPPSSLTAVGVALALLFFLSLLALPPSRHGRDRTLFLLAAISPVTIFAVERGNFDLLIFVLTVGAGMLLRGAWPMRAPAYALILVAGLVLKFYPLVLLLSSLRERPRLFAAVSVAAGALVLLFAILFTGELAALAAHISASGGNYEGDFSGARNFFLMMENVARAVGAQGPGLPLAAVALLVAATLWRAAVMARRDPIRRALAELPPSEALYLILGAALVSGCFFAGQSIASRAIDLLLALPGLVALSWAATRTEHRALFLRMSVMVVLLMWMQCFRHAAIALAWGPLLLLLWVARELMWWYVVGGLLGLLFCFAADSAVVRSLRARAKLDQGVAPVGR
jgi:Glycosyltransferase family 87